MASRTRKANARKSAVRSSVAVPAFGYKNNISIDRRHGLIRRWTATNAAAHDGARLADLIDVFAYQKGPMGLLIRTIGMARARVKIGLANLAYNMRRYVWLSHRTAAV